MTAIPSPLVRSAFTILLVAGLAVVGSLQFTASQAATGTLPAVPTTLPSGPPLGPPRAPLAAPVVVPPPPSNEGQPLLGLAAQPIATGLENPLLVTSPPGDPRLFIIEKPGRIRVVADGRLLPTPFLDLTDEVLSAGAEQGLLGLAFHPQYRWNGRFFVYYTDELGDTHLVQYRAGIVDPNLADPGSGRELLFLDQPQEFHQSGMMIFGPDGYLWMTSGDGGGIGDQYGNGQRPDTLFGVVIRIDVDSAEPYAIPPDNPYVGSDAGAPEVWAYGLRNAWRFTIDPVENMIYLADVGQFRWEEVSAQPLAEPGLNYGWPVVEGLECYEADTCDTSGLIAPVIVYSHSAGCAVIGGHVYRGKAIPELNGHYFYGDWCGQWVRSFRLSGGRATALADWSDDLGSIGQPLSFGLDAEGELYLTTGAGVVYKIVPRR